MPREWLRSAVRRVAIMTPAGVYASQLRIEKDFAVLRAGHPMLGFAETRSRIEYNGPTLTTYCEHRHLAQANRAGTGEEIAIWFDPNGRRPAVAELGTEGRLLIPTYAEIPTAYVNALNWLHAKVMGTPSQ